MRLPLLGLSAILFAPGVAHATKVLTVGAGGTYPTIGAAIGQATTGDRIQVLPGTYTECLSVDTFDLWIYGLNGSGATSIECTGSPYALTLTNAAKVRLDGFTVSNSGGGGVQGTGNSQVLLRDVRMDGMTSSTGGGCVDVTGGVAVLYDTTLANCSGTAGGAVRVSGPGAVLGLVRTDITGANATAGDGGGVLFNGQTMFGSQSDIRDSTATGRGGGLYIASNSGQNTLLADFTIEDNDANYGGGIYATTPLVLLDTDLRRNHAFQASYGGEGGAVQALASFTMRRGEVTDNVGDYYMGGGLFLQQGGTLVGVRLANNTIGLGTGYGYGGAVASLAALTTHGCVMENNDALNGGGAVYGGSAWTSNDDQFLGNGGTVGSGGAAYAGNATFRRALFDGNASSVQGGAIWAYNNVTISDSEFIGNSAPQGGAMSLAGGTSNSILRSAVVQNTATSAGGGVFLGTTTRTTIDHSRFEGNVVTAGDGGAVYNSRTAPPDCSVGPCYGFEILWTLLSNNQASDEGGAIYANNGQMTVQYSWITHNTATNRGGGMYAFGGVPWSQYGNVYCENSTSGEGGGFYGANGSSNGFIQYTAWVSNSANSGGAVYEDGHVGTGFTRLYYNTALGNTSTLAGHSNVVAGPTGRVYVYFNVVQGNGTVGVKSLNGSLVAPYPLYVYYSDFQGSPPGSPPPPFVIYESAGGVSSSGNNATPNPPTELKPIPDGNWSDDGDCFNDDLTAMWVWQELNLGVPTNGVSINELMYTDDDGDGDAIAQRDCQTGNGAVWVGATEVAGNTIDDDCDLGDESDVDSDGFSPTSVGGADCSENNTSMGPLLIDIAGNGLDEDCFNGDETDGDHDGAAVSSDCADGDPLRNSYQLEVPHDGVDQNCLLDEDDEDGDGFAGNTWGGPDCNDQDSAFNPDAAEIYYDGRNQNCDSLSDFDADLDGSDSQTFGGTDCNDSDPDIHPGATEVPYDAIDQNCDSWNDYDGDLDGFVATAYNALAGGTAPGTDDCDDSNPNTYPGAPEITDGQDNTCDGVFNPDPDFDGDGVLDWWENAFGSYFDVTDSDGDGLSDGVEWGLDEQHPDDADGDGTIDALETDSDNDALLDAFEGLADHDSDGLEDYRDADDDGDGILTTIETDGLGPAGPDTDADGVPDWLDVDSDDDGALDVTEGTGDTDGDGIGAWRDDGSEGTGEGVVPKGPDSYGFGCGCQSAPGTGLGSAWLLGLAVLLRRPARTPRRG